MPDGPSPITNPQTPDFGVYPLSPAVSAADHDGRSVAVTWSDGAVARLHVMWLRENAAEDHTCHPVTREQQVQLTEFDADLTVRSAEPDAGGALVVSWSDGVSSRFHPGWLRAHGGPEAAESRDLPPIQIWNPHPGLDEICFDGPAALRDPAVEAAWIRALHVHGAAVLKGLDASEQVIETVPSRIGPIRTTNFGHIFEVRSKPDADSNAYTAMTLPVHTDLPTREYAPGLQFLHCLQNEAVGGDSLLADGFRIAAHLRKIDPEAFDTLTTVPLLHANKAKTTDYREWAPMIRLDDNGDFVEVRWNPWLRAPLRAPFETVDRVYRALRLVFELAERPEMQLKLRLGAGDLLGFDNRRVLHGRTGFDPATGDRWLRGCYVEREELWSRARILARQA